jgi:tRNA threonylcarbamoyladenosine modification (KEOPS) complex  Pcc1 subunit
LSRSTSESEATVTIQYVDQRTAEAILRAIEPDNLATTGGVKIDAEASGGVVTINVECSRGIGSLVATLDDLLSCIQAAEAALGELQA